MSSFPLLVVVVALGRLPYMQKPFIVAIKSCLLSFHRLAPSRLWQGVVLSWFSKPTKACFEFFCRQRVHFSECTSPRWRRCFGLRPVVLPSESLVCSFMGTDVGGVNIISLVGGLILHVLLAPSPLASSCESVGDVLALLC
jgi:hypothetical protein